MLFRVIFIIMILLLVTKCSCSCGIAVRWRNSARGVYFFEVEDFGVCIVILRSTAQYRCCMVPVLQVSPIGMGLIGQLEA